MTLLLRPRILRLSSHSKSSSSSYPSSCTRHRTQADLLSYFPSSLSSFSPNHHHHHSLHYHSTTHQQRRQQQLPLQEQQEEKAQHPHCHRQRLFLRNYSHRRPFSSFSSFSSTSSSSSSSSSPSPTSPSLYHRIKPKLVQFGTLTVAGASAYIIFRGAMGIVDFFTSINFLDVAEAAFVAGVMSTCTVILTGVALHRLVSLRPEHVYSTSLKRVQQSSAVKAIIGDGIEPMQFRAYSFVPGEINLPGYGKLEDPSDSFVPLSRFWHPSRLQLFFQVRGSQGAGMVSVEVSRTVRGVDTYHTLSVTALEDRDTQARVVLEGDVNYQIYQGVIKLR